MPKHLSQLERTMVRLLGSIQSRAADASETIDNIEADYRDIAVAIEDIADDLRVLRRTFNEAFTVAMGGANAPR